MKPPQFIDSKDLLKVCPRLEKQDGWKEFASEFDQPKFRKNREKAAQDSRLAEMPESVRELSGHCSIIRSRKSLFRHDGSTFYLSDDEFQRKQIIAAVALAEKVELLFKPSAEGRRLWQDVESEIKRRRCPPSKRKRRNTTDICQALLAFIAREKRLPFKKELNLEANRLHKCEGGYPGEYAYEEVVYRDKAKTGSRADRYRIYDCELKFSYDGNGRRLQKECRIVPWHEWEAPRWDTTQYPDVSTPSGLKRLPEAHADKGKARN